MDESIYGEPFCILLHKDFCTYRIAARWVHDENCEAECDESIECQGEKYCGFMATAEIQDGIDGMGLPRWVDYLPEYQGVQMIAQALVNETVKQKHGPLCLVGVGE